MCLPRAEVGQEWIPQRGFVIGCPDLDIHKRYPCQRRRPSPYGQLLSHFEQPRVTGPDRDLKDKPHESNPGLESSEPAFHARLTV